MSELQATKAADAPGPDRLAAVFARVRLTARVFHTGPFCGMALSSPTRQKCR